MPPEHDDLELTDEGHPAHLGQRDDGRDLVDDEDLEGTQQTASESELEMLRQQIREAQERERQYHQTLNRFMSQAPASQQPQAESAESLYDYSDLPDPVEKPEEFKKQLADRQRRIAEYQALQTTQHHQRQQAVGSLEAKFREKYPELAKRTILLGGATSAEVAALRAQGLDPTSVAMNDSDGFLDRVAKRMRDELGGPDDRRPSPSRTKGLGGGSFSKGNAPRKGNEKVVGFADQLKKAQLDGGLI